MRARALVVCDRTVDRLFIVLVLTAVVLLLYLVGLLVALLWLAIGRFEAIALLFAVSIGM